jgi:hypothetical protein
MLASSDVALTICAFAGTIIVPALAARADDKVPRVPYDTKHWRSETMAVRAEHAEVHA